MHSDKSHQKMHHAMGWSLATTLRENLNTTFVVGWTRTDLSLQLSGLVAVCPTAGRDTNFDFSAGP